MRKKRYGKAGEDLIILVPAGTIVTDETTGLVMKDLVNDGDFFVAAKGGKGGKGNTHYANSVRQAPNFAEAGGALKERTVILELKLIADVGLVGFPNVGKSTLLSVATNSKPKIANYHFTTLDPNLGVVQIYDNSFVMADIAGIIEGAHKGAGLGIRFLKHIERTKVLIHIVDVSGSEGRDPIDDFKKINEELTQYDKRLIQKPQIVAANKIDLIGEDSQQYRDFKESIEKEGYKVLPMSAATGSGVKPVLAEAARILETIPEDDNDALQETFDFEREDSDEGYRKIIGGKDEKGIYYLEGRQLEKIFDSTNFNDIGSLRYLFKYIEKSGGLEQLKALGIKDGDTLRIKNYEMEYYDD